MKHILAFIAILAIVAFAKGFYVFGGLVVLFIVVILLFLIKRGEKVLNMYFAMPTVWQNIQETLEIGFKFGVIDEFVSVYHILTFYNVMEANDELFEIKVSEQLVGSFELKYGKPLQLIDQPTRNRALCYFIDAAMFRLERLPEILGSVHVRKKVRGKRGKDPEKEASMELRPIYTT
ncbi:MAG: hypothetical protein A2937_02940 [Candidatus Yonathbacteria bacterium RIFCSPLOWO2_01_FULL_47_33b]|uniref:Uncharacterized protein n=1 Tax=Candidatus Yonathbacteria bacterium RIFCSPLOWO2_01_FULL_47_33b TaxID=1802727 RepID=A0A1G2SGK0_9BACT|nr:MAG: hypothetical protein A2937_02940 [Candidatus Yonathbacteria bacterium RIFCSPLOWO2_01_FULL_47_33b]